MELPLLLSSTLTMCVIGLLVNPIAGLGGAVGLKGTDGQVGEARARGALPRASGRAMEALALLSGLPVCFISCSGAMGEEALRNAGVSRYEVVYRASSGLTSADDTVAACRIFLERNVDLVLFCGGDGTARDVYSVLGDATPMLGIPAGVKMYSAVFAVTPTAAARIVMSGCREGGHFLIRDAEVVDVDEEAYREGELKTHLFGIAKSPYVRGLIQSTKQVFESHDEERAKTDIAHFIREVMDGTPDILYILGPGSTTAAIAGELDLKKTLLGFDAVKGGALVASDLHEQAFLALLKEGTQARLVISIIGAQGALLGRGTQQVSPNVIRIIGIENIIVVATPQKLTETPVVFVDTGDPDLDTSFGTHISVISGYRIARRIKIGTGEIPSPNTG